MGDVSSRLQGNDDEGQPGRPDEVVKVRSVDMYVTYNAENHFTRGFSRTKSQNPAPVLRRGQSFTMVINLNRPFNPTSDALSLFFRLEGVDRATPYSKDTVSLVPVDSTGAEALTSGAWSAAIRKAEEKSLLVEVMAPVTCIVGSWFMDVDSKLRNASDSVGATYTYPDPLYILFNPWNKDDTVYMENAEWRFEYVLAHSGIIWRGTYNSMRPSPWKYGHFEENVLDCCLYLLRHVGKLPVQSCANPVAVVRHISAVVNSSDDQGVLMGNWTSNFAGGVPPVSWTGSHPILQQYFKTKRPVKYGQCWVFAGVTTAVCRALGIPARTVTNFYSAHDTHASATVDQFYDTNANTVDKLNTDSIWNFHVWNEVWMKRPDLGKEEYDGWQVIDATPQEMSGGIFSCGPASVRAIKEGDLAKPYDGTFVFAEVNADQIYWRYESPRKPLKMLKKCTDKIGKNMSTKAVGRWEREDITHEYKFAEGTQKERDIVLKALRENNHAYSRFYLNESMDDVQFTIEPIKDVLVGSGITVRAKAVNKSASKRYACKVILRVETVTYTGVTKRALKHQNYPLNLMPGAEELLTLDVAFKDYSRDVSDQASFKVTMMANVPEVKYDYIVQEDFMLSLPEIEIKAYGPVIVGKRQKFTASFQNPLPTKLTRCFFAVEGPGLSRPYYLSLREPVQQRSEAWIEFALTPATSGPRSIAAKFSSTQLADIEGFLEVVVKGEEVTPEAAPNGTAE
uniref:protein-glutamine gamma-glutamyltransferase n=1 Tax=Amblyomma parvum TaxID=251391 RepID=A0A023G034_AMBPA